MDKNDLSVEYCKMRFACAIQNTHVPDVYCFAMNNSFTNNSIANYKMPKATQHNLSTKPIVPPPKEKFLPPDPV